MSEIVFMLVKRRIKTHAKIILSQMQLFLLAFIFIPYLYFGLPAFLGSLSCCLNSTQSPFLLRM